MARAIAQMRACSNRAQKGGRGGYNNRRGGGHEKKSTCNSIPFSRAPSPVPALGKSRSLALQRPGAIGVEEELSKSHLLVLGVSDNLPLVLPELPQINARRRLEPPPRVLPGGGTGGHEGAVAATG